MSFNSVLFVVFFLPIVLAVYYSLSVTRFHWLRLPFLIMSGLLFYARNQPTYLPLLIGSALLNYSLGVAIEHAADAPKRRNSLVIIGIVANAGMLIYWKFFSAIFTATITAMGLTAPTIQIVVPLAISFYTFQQIAFLVDVSRNQTRPGSIVDYLAYITFFPQLLSGPISLHQEIVPQLQIRPAVNQVYSNILIGLIIFSIGLFKKTVVADSASLLSDPFFSSVATGGQPDCLSAWLAATICTLQIYFDFSGYSDMAIGVGRMFGILMPLNFFSPFRSNNIVEFWQRWHITLGRFVRLYIFQPLALPLNRFASNNHLGPWSWLAVATLLPTMLSMIIIGVWHGPNLTYFIFGVLQGVFICIHEIYAYASRKTRRKKIVSSWRLGLNCGLTLASFVVSSAVFRASDISTAQRIILAMFGAGWFRSAEETFTTPDLFSMTLLIGVCGAIVFLLPNTEQFMTRITPALAWEQWREVSRARIPITFDFSAGWLATVISALFLGLVFIARGTQNFVYFQF